MIEITGLRFRIPGTERDLFADLNAAIAKGEFAVLWSTSFLCNSWIARLLTGDSAEYSGEISVGGTSPKSVTASRWGSLLRTLGVVASDHPLLEDRDIQSNIELPLEIDGKLAGETRHRVHTLMRRLGLSAVGRSRPHEVSYSERQRALLARSLVREPLVLILEDPTLGLSDEHVQEFAGLLVEQQLRGMTVVLISSDLRIAALVPQAKWIEIPTTEHSSVAL